MEQTFYYTCIKCRRYNICQPFVNCCTCDKYKCFACYQKENDEELFKNGDWSIIFEVYIKLHGIENVTVWINI